MYKSISYGLLGVSSGKSLIDDIEFAAQSGFAGINMEIQAIADNFSPSAFTDLLEKTNLKYGGFGLPFDFRGDTDTFENGLQEFKASCAFAQKIKADRCTTWIMPYSDTLDYKTNFELHTQRLRSIAMLMETYGIKLGLEFVGPPSMRRGKTHAFIHNLDGLGELINASGASNIGYLLDAFHWDLSGQVYADFSKIPAGSSIVMAHINDGVRGLSAEEQQDQSRELPGVTGFVRIGEFMQGLQKLDYDGPVLVEPFNQALRERPFAQAVKLVKDSMDTVWPE